MEHWEGVVPLIATLVPFQYLPSLRRCSRLLIKLYFVSIVAHYSGKTNQHSAAGSGDVDKYGWKCWLRSTTWSILFPSIAETTPRRGTFQ